MADLLITPSESTDGYAHIQATRNNRLIRFYLWLYKADEDAINTCKLFWAYVLVLPALLLRGILGVVGLVAPIFPDKDEEAETERAVAAYRERRAKREAKEAAGPSRMERILDGAADKLTRLWAKIETPVVWTLYALGVVFILVGAGLLVYVAVTATTVLLVALAWIVGIMLLAALIVLTISRLERRSRRNGGLPFFQTIKRLAVGFHRHTCAKVNLSRE